MKEKPDVTWRIFGMYMLIIILMVLAGTVKAQVQVVVFNAGWNEVNKVDWAYKLEDVETYSYIDVSKDTKLQMKHKIAVIPTIIIFKDDEEVARFQADLSFKMVATREDVQEEINNQLMSDF
tara:strand:+ start:518 stop:883 length:366 start_codon:yes stop_codon:yes gene_type:complete